MKDKYANRYIESIHNCVTDDDLKIVIDKIYDDGFQDGCNEGNHKSEKRILLARKPYDVADIKKQITDKISPAELARLVKEKKIEERTFKDWQALIKVDLSEQQFWRVFLEAEDELLFIDTSGYDYPRYVGLIEKESDKLSDDEMC